MRGRSKELLSSARRRALRKGQRVTITQEWIEEKLAQGHCEATGIAFDMDRRGGSRPFSPSLDQKVAGLGYTPTNTQVVVLIHNTARGPWGDAAVHAYVIAVAKRLGVT